jgi:hypothetical protein
LAIRLRYDVDPIPAADLVAAQDAVAVDQSILVRLLVLVAKVVSSRSSRKFSTISAGGPPCLANKVVVSLLTMSETLNEKFAEYLKHQTFLVRHLFKRRLTI